MDILKRELSPITAAAWAEIDTQARKMITTHLSARTFADISGPHGWDFAALPLGRLDVPKGQKGDDVRYGIHAVLRLVEARVSFTMDRWELDNVDRGAKDIDFKNLDDAARKIALFEENLVYKGFAAADIVGIAEAAKGNSVKLDRSGDMGILPSLGKAVRKLQDASVEGPYTLVVGPDLWNTIQSTGGGYPLNRRITGLIGGEIVVRPSAEEAYLISTRGGDMELVIGQDIAIGFEAATEKDVRLFITESLAFRVMNPDAIVTLG